MDLSLPEVAKRLGIHRVTAWRWYHRGYFPNAYRVDPHNPDSDVRVPEKDVIALEEKRKETRKERQDNGSQINDGRNY